MIFRLIRRMTFRALLDALMFEGGHYLPVLRVNVAAFAISLEMIDGGIRLMAGCTFGDAYMVELKRRPISDEVTIRALTGEMLRRRRVAGRALGGRAFVCAGGMAGITLYLVTAFQREEAVVDVASQEGDGHAPDAQRRGSLRQIGEHLVRVIDLNERGKASA